MAGLLCFGQGKYATKSGQLMFEASVPSFEEVKARNENVSAILNSDTGEFAVLALMQGFRFKVALMEEHFNENYAESNTYPKATFKGKIDGFSLDQLSEDPKEFQINGTLTMHGVSKTMKIPVKMNLLGNDVRLSTYFSTRPSDFNIEIPKVVRNKIAETIDVEGVFNLSN